LLHVSSPIFKNAILSFQFLMNETNAYGKKHENAVFHVLILMNDVHDDVHGNGAQLIFIILLMKSN